ELVHRREINSQQFHAILLQPRRNIRCDHRDSLWKNCRVAPTAGLYEKARSCSDLFSLRTKVLASNQMFFRRLGKSFCEIDYGCTTEITVERCFFDRCTINIEMKSSISMSPIMQAHRDRTEIYARSFCDFIRNTITKRFVTGPFGKLIR